MAAQFPSGFNTYVPNFDAGGKLVVSFSREPKKFPLTQYITITPVKKDTGVFWRLTAENAARILSASAHDFIWPYGNDEPAGETQTESQDTDTYKTVRRAFPFRLPNEAIDQADYDVEAFHAANAAQQAMTARTILAATALQTTGNFPSGHTATATAAGGAKWDVGTVAAPAIKKGLNFAALQIEKATLAAVSPDDLILVVGSEAAGKMAASEEIHNYLSQSPFALKEIMDGTGPNSRYGLPGYLYGYKVVVENSIKVTSLKGGTLASARIWNDDSATLLARPGGLVGKFGGVSFSTCSFFMKEEMTVESKDDPDNRRRKGRVVEDYDVKIVAGATGFVFTDILT